MELTARRADAWLRGPRNVLGPPKDPVEGFGARGTPGRRTLRVRGNLRRGGNCKARGRARVLVPRCSYNNFLKEMRWKEKGRRNRIELSISRKGTGIKMTLEIRRGERPRAIHHARVAEQEEPEFGTTFVGREGGGKEEGRERGKGVGGEGGRRERGRRGGKEGSKGREGPKEGEGP